MAWLCFQPYHSLSQWPGHDSVAGATCNSRLCLEGAQGSTVTERLSLRKEFFFTCGLHIHVAVTVHVACTTVSVYGSEGPLLQCTGFVSFAA